MDTRKQLDIIIIKGKQQHLSPISSIKFNSTGSSLALGGSDGWLRIYPGNVPYAKPSFEVPNAHSSVGGSITSIAFAETDHQLATRSLDGTMKIWDLRNLKANLPLHVLEGLPNLFDETKCIYSPHGEYLITGTSAEREKSNGSIKIFSCKSMELEQTLGTYMHLFVFGLYIGVKQL